MCIDELEHQMSHACKQRPCQEEIRRCTRCSVDPSRLTVGLPLTATRQTCFNTKYDLMSITILCCKVVYQLPHPQRTFYFLITEAFIAPSLYQNGVPGHVRGPYLLWLGTPGMAALGTPKVQVLRLAGVARSLLYVGQIG